MLGVHVHHNDRDKCLSSHGNSRLRDPRSGRTSVLECGGLVTGSRDTPSDLQSTLPTRESESRGPPSSGQVQIRSRFHPGPSGQPSTLHTPRPSWFLHRPSEDRPDIRGVPSWLRRLQGQRCSSRVSSILWETPHTSPHPLSEVPGTSTRGPLTPCLDPGVSTVDNFLFVFVFPPSSLTFSPGPRGHYPSQSSVDTRRPPNQDVRHDPGP